MNTKIIKTFFFFSIIIGLVNCNPEKAENQSYNFGKVKIIMTADSTEFKLKDIGAVQFSEIEQLTEGQVWIFVYPEKKYQTFLGIGGAITDASAETFAKLPKENQDKFIKSYFDKNDGIGYSVIRTNMNSCDFSSDMYTYIDEGDKELKSFDIGHDKKFKIPLIKKALEYSPDANIFLSPWSPPAFMKSNNDMLHGGNLLPEYFQSWAEYYIKFIEEYKKEGIDIWGLTIQNEPKAVQRWESCIYSAQEERDFLKNYLGPTLYKNNLRDKKVIFWDHNRDLIPERAHVMLDDPEAKKYVWGIGFHWYEPWSGGEMMFNNVEEVHKMYPDKNLFFTEGCADSYDSTKILNWRNGEKYAHSMINDFNCGTVGWTDWNILLDQNGGPNHVGNFCFAPVHANTETGELIYTPSYYYIGHFSKYIKAGAKRISSVPSRSQLECTTFQNPDGQFVTIVLNRTDKKIKYMLHIENKAADIEILPHSIQTILY